MLHHPTTFGISVEIGTIGWKLYPVVICWRIVELFVETAGKIFVEMSGIFDAKNPVLKSLDKTTYDEDGQIVNVEPATSGKMIMEPRQSSKPNPSRTKILQQALNNPNLRIDPVNYQLSNARMSQNNIFGVACKTCRRRGRKCDRSLPKCNSCSLRGVECEGYVLRWVDGAPSKGKSSKGDVEKKPRAIVRQQNFGIMDLRTAGDGLGNFVNYCIETQSPGHYPTDHVLDAREISEAFYLGHGPAETPYTRHVLPMIRSVPSVRCAVAATAACHIANRREDDQLKRQSLHLRLKATELLRMELEDLPNGPDLTSLLCMLLLAQLDVCSGDCVEFETHLRAASAFIKLRGSDGTERGFIEQRIAWLDVMGATTSSRMLHWSPEDLTATLNKFKSPSGEREWGFDVFYCPVDLFEYIANITVLYKLEPDAIQKAVLLGNAIKRWVCVDESDPRRHMVERNF
ncbi:hypothetical protein V494_06501 [Pseudogymnoascus sp. VKM F-4513 (FW-928)]|nr:hypothetical protein V494_06501 [Pseudogymnoascus sp. VKM F-4513 (FW-928)]